MPDVLFGATGVWIALIVALVVLLAIDLLVARNHHTPRDAAYASVGWFGLGLAFTVVFVIANQPDRAGSYLAGYLVERSLSLDNVFVFLLVFSFFGVPDGDRLRLLSWGIVGALVLRALFIVAGVALLETFHWVNFIFAALLFWTAWRMFDHRHDDDAEAAVVQRIATRLRFSPAVAALVAIALVDILFAIDSVPAILAITTDTFVVFAANAFALLGLRPLFFIVAHLVARLRHLKTALAVLLAFIAGKMVWAELFGKVGPEVSLPVIALILGTGIVLSLRAERHDETTETVQTDDYHRFRPSRRREAR